MSEEQNVDGTGGSPAPDAVATPAAGDNAAPAWIAQCSDDLKGNEALTGYKTISDLAKDTLSLKEKATALEGKLATDYIPKLTENATDEQKAAYKAAMGVPDSVDGYEIPVTDGVVQSPELIEAFKQFALSINMPKDMAAASVKWNDVMTSKAEAAFKDFIQKDISAKQEALKSEWGTDYDKNAETVKTLFQTFKDVPELDDVCKIKIGGTDDKPVLFGSHPAALKLFYEIGKRILPDSILPGSSTPTAQKNKGFSYPNSPAPPKGD